MCRIDERVYINSQGHRSKFEEAFPCDKARKGKLCANVKKRTTEYWPKKGGPSRDDTPSPMNPPTPTGTGSYIVEQRRPSSSGGRPSALTREGKIIIEFGSKNKKGKTYTGSFKRSPDDIAVESPSSDASHTVRTGFPEAPLPTPTAVYGHADPYGTTHAVSHGFHHRQASSTSSHTGSSRTPSLYVTSDDYDSPTQTRSAMLAPSIHQTYAAAAPSSPSRSGAHGKTSSYDYNLSVVAPRGHSHESRLQDHDYHDFADRSASSHASSGASGPSRRRKDPEQSRKRNDEDEENVKQVRFELGRANSRAEERAETRLAESEKQRALDREEARRQKERERDEEAAKSRRKEKSQPSTSNTTKRPSKTRRESTSMTLGQKEEQRRLLAAELDHMQDESRAAEAREREERAALLRQQQQDTSYYNPRAGGMPNNASNLTRRNSTSRRDSLTSDTRPMLGRSNSRRTSIIQPNPPLINTSVAQPSARTHAPPPVSFPANFNPRPTSSRRPSLSSQDRPFLENPFMTTPPILSPSAVLHQDPWDARNLREALQNPRTVDERYTKASGTHGAARQATRAMGRVAGFQEDYTTDSDDDVRHGHGRRKR